MALTDEQKKKIKKREEERAAARKKAADAFKANPSSIPKKYQQSEVQKTTKRNSTVNQKTVNKNYTVGKNGSLKAKATTATKDYISGKSNYASGKKLSGTEKLRNSVGWNMTQEERFLKQRQYQRTSADKSKDKQDSKLANAFDEAKTKFSVADSYSKYAQQKTNQAKKNAEEYKKTGDSKYLTQAKKDANSARVFQTKMKDSALNAVEAEKNINFHFTNHKYEQYLKDTNPEYKSESKLSSAKDRVETAKKALQNLQGLMSPTALADKKNQQKIKDAEKELKAAQKEYDKLLKTTEAGAKDKYEKMFGDLSTTSAKHKLQIEAESLVNIAEPTLTQQAEIRAIKKIYDQLPDKDKDKELSKRLYANSGTTMSRITQTVGAGVSSALAGLERVPEFIEGLNETTSRDIIGGGEGKKPYIPEGAAEAVSVVDPETMEKKRQKAMEWLDKQATKQEKKATARTQNAKQNASELGQAAVDLGITMTQIGMDTLAGGPTRALAAMGARVLGSTYHQAKEAGADTDDAVLYAGLQAGKELLTEKLFGAPFLKVYGKGLLGKSVEEAIEKGIDMAATRAASKAGERAVKTFLTTLSNFAEEGAEEGISGILDPVVSAITIGDKEDLQQYKLDNKEFWSDIGYQILLGGVAGLFGGSVNQIAEGLPGVSDESRTEIEEARKLKQEAKAAKAFMPTQVSDFSQGLIEAGVKNKAAVNADNVLSNLVEDETQVSDKQINKMLDDLHITKKGAKTAGAVRSLESIKSRLGLTELGNDLSRADLVKAIREGARLTKDDETRQKESDIREAEAQQEIEEIDEGINEAEATINEEELKGRKILVPEEFGDTPITFDQFHEMITEDVPGITEDMIMSEWAGHVARNGINEEQTNEEEAPVNEEEDTTLRDVFGIGEEQQEAPTQEMKETLQRVQEEYNEVVSRITAVVSEQGQLVEQRREVEDGTEEAQALDQQITALQEQLNTLWAEQDEVYERLQAASRGEAIEETPEDYDEMAELADKTAKEQRNSRFRNLIPRDSYVNGEEYQNNERIRRETEERLSELRAEQSQLEEELKSESFPKPKEEWTTQDEIDSLLTKSGPQSYTERGEEINKRLDEIKKKVKALEKVREDVGDAFKKQRTEISKEQAKQWVHTKPQETDQTEFEYFQNTTGVPDAEEARQQGRAYVAMMSPKEYLMRCAFDIFTDYNTTYDNQIETLNPEAVAKYTEEMANGTKYFMPYLNYKNAALGQEGRHRAAAAYNLGVEKMPVLIIDYEAPTTRNNENIEVAQEFVNEELDTISDEELEDAVLEELDDDTPPWERLTDEELDSAVYTDYDGTKKTYEDYYNEEFNRSDEKEQENLLLPRQIRDAWRRLIWEQNEAREAGLEGQENGTEEEHASAEAVYEDYEDTTIKSIEETLDSIDPSLDKETLVPEISQAFRDADPENLDFRKVAESIFNNLPKDSDYRRYKESTINGVNEMLKGVYEYDFNPDSNLAVESVKYAEPVAEPEPAPQETQDPRATINFAYNEEAREQYGVEVEGPDMWDIPFPLKPEEVKGKKMDRLRRAVKDTAKDFGVKFTPKEVNDFAEDLNKLFQDFERGYREEEIRDLENSDIIYSVKRTNFRDPAVQQEAVERFAEYLIDRIKADNPRAINAYKAMYAEFKKERLLYTDEDAHEFHFVNDHTLLMKKVENGKGNVDKKYHDLLGDDDVKPYLERAMTDVLSAPGVENNGAHQNEFRAIILANQLARAERKYNPYTSAASEDSLAYEYTNMVQMASIDIYKMFTQVPSENDTVVGKGQKLARVVMNPQTNAARYLAFEQIAALEQELEQAGATKPSFGKNLQRNNNNQVMSKEQTKRFEKSVLRDNEGNMFVLYPVGNNQYTTTPTSNISRLQASYGNVTDPAEVQGNFRSMEEIQDEVDRAMAEDGVDGVVIHNVKMGDYEGDIVIPKERSQMTSTIDYGISNAPVRQENRPENAFRPAGQEAPTKKDGYTKYIEALRAKVKAKTKMDDEALDLSISQKGLVANPGEWNPRKNVSGRTELKKGMDSAYNIIQSFREHFGLQIGKGSIFTQKASGYYNTQTWEIRTRVHNDLPTVCHELGHHLDRQYFKGALGSFMDTTKGDTEADKAFRELLRNSDQVFLSNYKQKDHSKEAFAEYIREYFLDSDATEMRFPEFTKYFMNSISTRDRVMMQTFADDINAFFSVTADTAQSEIIGAKQLDDDFSSFRSRVGRKWNNFYQKMFDSNHAIKRFDEETGGKAHLLASIAPHSRERAANVLLRGVMDGDKYVGPGLVSVLKPISKHDMADFNEYLVCKHGVERKAVKGEDYGVFADPRHNNTEWLQNRAAELEEKHPEFKHVSENLYQFLNNVNEVWGVKTGLLSKDTVDAWNKQWQYYVPFQRRMEDDGKKSLKGSKNGFANQSAGIHSTRGGSGRQIIEPITSIENYVINLVNAGVRNNVMREITQTATMFDGNTAQFLVRERAPLQKREVETDKFKQQLLDEVSANEYFALDSEALGEIEDILEKLPNVITQYGRGRNSGDRVEVMVNGKPQTWRVTDPQLLESLVSMDPKTRNGALGLYQNCSRFIVGNITGNNILWALTSNFPRDLVTYYTFAKTKNPIKLFGNLGSSYVQKTKDLLGGQTSQYYEEYLAMGGGHTSYYSSDVGTNAKILEKVHPGVKTWFNPMNLVSAIADTIEFGPRYATYKLAREQGYTPEEAMFQAVDITVNFARGGTMSRELNVIFPFFNASLQGIDKFARWISANEVPKDNRAHATVARTAGFFTASALAGALMWGINGGFDDDDEKKKHFAQLSNYTKNSFWTIPTSLFGSDKEGEYLCIPKAREINVLSSLITDALSYWENEDKEAFKEFKDYMSDNFLPSAGSAVVTMFTEDLGKGIDELLGSIGVAGPVFYIRANRDFLGRPIVPSYMLTSKEPQDIYKDTTTRLAKNVVDAVQKVAPNSFFKSVNPMQIDFFFQNTLGGWWKIYKALDPINPEYQDKLIGIKNQYFKYSTSSNDLVDSFYDKRDALTKKHGSSDSIDVAIQKKLYDNMATFYSGYNDMLKGMGKDEQRIAKQQMLDMMQSFMDSMDSGDYTSAQKDVFKFIRDNGLTDALPQGLKPELSYSLTKHGEYSNETTTTKKALNADQYYNYQTEYLNNYYDGMSALIDSDWSDYEIEGMEGSQDSIKKKAANTMKSLAKSTTDAQLAAEWFDGKSNDQNLLNDLNTVGIELSDFAYLKSAFQYMENNHVYTDVLGETIKNGKQIYAANYIYALGDKYTAKQKDWIWNNAVSSDAYSEDTLAQVPWNNGGVNGIKPQKKSKTKIKPQNYKYRNEAELPGY